MHIELTFMDMVTLIGMLVGAVWVLLKMTAAQFNRGLDSRFASQDEKLKHVDGLLIDLKRIELEAARRDADYATRFCTKSDMREMGERSEKNISEMFTLLRRIDDKLDNKVSKDECSQCRGGQ